MRKLGVNQLGVIQGMQRHSGWWYAGCGWLWDTHSGTERICRSLVNRGLVEQHGNQYKLTAAGKSV